ncbi:MAG: diphosphomevalonate decarboxylase [Bacteriovoracaceae bacterium]
MNLLAPFKNIEPKTAVCSWRSPSNIALVKYWGKKGHQLPANPSLSMTLKECFTETTVKFEPAGKLEVTVNFEGKSNEKFADKIRAYLQSLKNDLPWIEGLTVTVDTKNTFPHGTGIASSASGLSAFALCLTDYMQPTMDELFMKRASSLARLASGSACRSVYGGFTTWGDVSDEYASLIEVHKELTHLHDTIVVVSGKEKSVSSTAGHGRMTEHAFREARYQQARDNFRGMKEALTAGDMAEVGRITENEALSLHAMMMTAPESFTLLRPQSLSAMEIIRDFRKQSGLPVYFTLDAGPNLHLIYPEEGAHKIETFIEHELSPLSEKIIKDQRGEGPVPC